MLHEKPGDTGMGADAGSGEWTGKKRCKQLGTSLHSEVRTSSSDSPAQEDQGDAFFTAADLEKFHTSIEEMMYLKNFTDIDIVVVNKRRFLDDKTQRDVYERLALYLLKAHKLSKMESIDEETLKKDLPDFLVKRNVHISQLHVDVDTYFNLLEKKEGGSLYWYFDPKFSMLQDLGNYQRLVLKDQWLKKHIGKEGSAEWRKLETRGGYQALKLARQFPGLTRHLANTAYKEHIWSLRYNHWLCEEWDAIFFAIWVRVTKQMLKFTPALKEVINSRSFPRHEDSMLLFLENREWSDLKSKYDSCVKDIPPGALDGDAKELIREAVLKLPRPNILSQYKEKKMEIARGIGLDKDCSEPRMQPWYGNCKSVQLVGRVNPGSFSSTPSQAFEDTA